MHDGVQYFLQLWEFSASENPVKLAIMSAMVPLVRSLGQEGKCPCENAVGKGRGRDEEGERKEEEKKKRREEEGNRKRMNLYYWVVRSNFLSICS